MPPKDAGRPKRPEENDRRQDTQSGSSRHRTFRPQPLPGTEHMRPGHGTAARQVGDLPVFGAGGTSSQYDLAKPGGVQLDWKLPPSERDTREGIFSTFAASGTDNRGDEILTFKTTSIGEQKEPGVYFIEKKQEFTGAYCFRLA